MRGVGDPATPNENATTAATSPADAHDTVMTPTGWRATAASAKTGTTTPSEVASRAIPTRRLP